MFVDYGASQIGFIVFVIISDFAALEFICWFYSCSYFFMFIFCIVDTIFIIYQFIILNKRVDLGISNINPNNYASMSSTASLSISSINQSTITQTLIILSISTCTSSTVLITIISQLSSSSPLVTVNTLVSSYVTIFIVIIYKE